MNFSEFNRDLMDAQARALSREPSMDEESLADSEEVAEVLARYKRPTPPHDPERGREWANRIMSDDLG